MADVPGMVYRCRNLPDWPMIFVSAGAEELCGYRPQELVNGAPCWRDVMYPADRERIWSTVQASLREQHTYELEYRVVARSGEIKWVWERGHAVDPDKPATLLAGFITDVTARKRQQEELLGAQVEATTATQARDAIDERYRRLFQTAGCVMIRISAAGLVLEWNYAAELLHDSPLADVIGKDYVEMFVAERDRTRTRAALLRVLGESSVSNAFECGIVDRTGHEHTLHWNVTSERDSRFGPIGIVAIGNDVSIQKNYAAALVRSEAYFKAIVDTARDAIITIDEPGQIEIFNAAAERLLGYTFSEVLGENISMLMSDGSCPQQNQHLPCDPETGKATLIDGGCETLARHKDGSRIPVHLSVAKISAPGRRAYAVMIRNLSRQKETEAALHREHERLNTIIEQAPMGIVIRRVDGRPVQVNRTFCDMTGYSEQEFLQMTCDEITHPDDRAASAALEARIQAGQISRCTERNRYLRKDGSVLGVQVATTVTGDLNGKPEFLISEIEDLTPRLQAEAEARDYRERIAHVERLNTLGEMAGGIAHEINQPLTAISLFAQAGKRLFDMGQQERAREMFDKLSVHALRAGAIIERVQTMARRRGSTTEAVDCKRLIKDVVKLAEAEARIYDISIRIDAAPELPVVTVDVIQIQQVILNLLRNGMQSMRSVQCRYGNSIILQVSRHGDHAVRVAVVDTGSGVSAEDAETLFIPFKTSKESGMGMGLSISRSIVTAHDGELAFFCNDTHGATFYFTLPVGDKEVSDG